MPQRFPFASHTNDHAALPEMGSEDLVQPKRLRRSSLLRKPLSLWRKHHADSTDEALPETAPAELEADGGGSQWEEPEPRRPSLPDEVLPICKRAIPSLPRPQTFRRQESERRERLLEVEPTTKERRARSEDMRRTSAVSRRALSPTPLPVSRLSALDIPEFRQEGNLSPASGAAADLHDPDTAHNPSNIPASRIPEVDTDHRPAVDDDRPPQGDSSDQATWAEEYDRRWILNLSMQFRDKSNREKFFVTYAETSTQWRRLTVSLDYRDAPPNSLEADLSILHYQRDKSLRIYEAIRDSLPDIQYYDTVTNLKLETTADDGQLHVHVREDANEIVNWPNISLFDHIQCPRFNETSLEFDSHLSGFVYKVRLNGRVVIKKEIPGPDTVDEFLYEVNALDSLLDSKHVVQLEGLVTDDRGELVKGLLISYAGQGALVDMIYDLRGTTALPWHRREKWAQQIVGGLADIHEAGFVQGDFTLSNIVIDEDDNAQIIDINRRGCPVGWEPPELNKLIDSGQRVSMSIGVKTDLFQLGMVLWALAEEVDEPERVQRPFPAIVDEVPHYFRDIVDMCLSERPQGRKGAVYLLQRFPTSAGQPPSRSASKDYELNSPLSDRSLSSSAHRSAKKYIDPDMAVTIDDVKEGRRLDTNDYSSLFHDAVTYMQPDSNPASMYAFESEGSCVVGRRRRTHSRGRSPVSSRRRRSSPYGRTASSATSYEASLPHRRLSRYGDDCSGSDGEQQHGCKDPDWGTYGAAEPREFEHMSPMARRIAEMQMGGASRATGLLHMDSGFDEVMEDHELGMSDVTERKDEPATPRPSSIQDAPTPGPYYTPGATPTSLAHGKDDERIIVALDSENSHENDGRDTRT